MSHSDTRAAVAYKPFIGDGEGRSSNKQQGVYLLHFDQPYPAGRHPQHYLGRTFDLPFRIKTHRNARKEDRTAARLMAAIRSLKINFEVAWFYECDWIVEGAPLEKRLKRAGHYAERICPICREQAYKRRLELQRLDVEYRAHMDVPPEHEEGAQLDWDSRFSEWPAA